jgi:flagellar hook assembly protein FlgD
MMGREIKAFEKTGLSAGVHSFVWDGTNNNGALVTSGIYISKFRAISQNGTSEVYEKTGKLMLLK